MAGSSLALQLLLVLTVWDQILSEDGVCLDYRMDLVIIVDSSSTLREENFELVLGLVEAILDEADIDSGNVRVGMLTFGTSSEIRFELDRYDSKTKIIDAVYSVEYSGGGSNMADALLAARSKVFSTQGDRPDAQNVIILITDGFSDINAHRTIQEAEMAKNGGIKIYTIGVGLQSTSEIDEISSKPLETFRHTADDWSSPVEIRKTMFPVAKCDGEFPLPVSETSVDRPLILGCDDSTMDLVLLVDTSVNTSNYYRDMLDFLSNFVDHLDIDSGAVHVAMVTFSSGPIIEFRLNKYSNKIDIQKGIRNAIMYPGRRNTADAFDALRRRIFFEVYGDRPEVPDIVLYFTTGNPNVYAQRTVQEAEALHYSDVNIFGVGIGMSDVAELELLVTSPAEKNIIRVYSVEDLKSSTNKILSQICRLSAAAFLTPVEDSEEQDLIFLLHFSNNMYKAEYKKILNFMIALIERADINSGSVRVGAALYRDTGIPIFNLKAYKTKKEVMGAIENIPFNLKSNRANLAAGINVVREQMFSDDSGDRQGVPNGIFVITDSNSNTDTSSIPEASKELKDTGTTIFTIGIDMEDPAEIVSVASNQEFSYILNDVAQLPAITTRLQDRVPSLSKLPLGPVSNFVPVGFPGGAIIGDLKSSEKADVVVLFHASNKLGAKEFNKGLELFISKLFEKAQVDSGDARVALVNFGANAKELFGLNKFDTKKGVRKEIQKMKPKPYRHGKANLVEGLKLVRTKTLTRAGGSRLSEGVPSALIIITDMASTSNANAANTEINMLKNDGVKVFTVGAKKADERELLSLASQPSATYHQQAKSYFDLVKGGDHLDKIRNEIQALTNTKLVPDTPKPTLPTTTAAPQTTTQTTLRTTKSVLVLPAIEMESFRKSKRQRRNLAITGIQSKHLIFVFQSSSSTSPKDYKKLLKYMNNFLLDFRIFNETQVSVVNFGKSSKVLVRKTDLLSSGNAILNLDKKLRSKQANLGIALKAINEELISNDARNTHVIIIADKKIDEISESFETEAEKLIRKGVHFHGISISNKPLADLQKITSQYDNIPYLQTLNGYSDLDNRTAVDQLLTSILFEPPETTTPSSKQREKTTKQKGKSKSNKSSADIVIAFHASSSVNKKTYKKRLLKYILNLVKKSSIDDGKVRIGLASFGETFQTVFNLGQYGKKKEVKKAIKKTPKNLKSDVVDLSSALENIRTRMFVAPGDRPDVQNYLILISDQDDQGDNDKLNEQKVLLNNTIVLAISIGSKDNQLRSLVNEPQKTFYQVFSAYDDLAKFKKSGRKIMKNIKILKGKKKKKGKKNKKGKKKQKTTSTTTVTTFTTLAQVDRSSIISSPIPSTTKKTKKKGKKQKKKKTTISSTPSISTPSIISSIKSGDSSTPALHFTTKKKREKKKKTTVSSTSITLTPTVLSSTRADDSSDAISLTPALPFTTKKKKEKKKKTTAPGITFISTPTVLSLSRTDGSSNTISSTTTPPFTTKKKREKKKKTTISKSDFSSTPTTSYAILSTPTPPFTTKKKRGKKKKTTVSKSAISSTPSIILSTKEDVLSTTISATTTSSGFAPRKTKKKDKTTPNTPFIATVERTQLTTTIPTQESSLSSKYSQTSGSLPDSSTEIKTTRSIRKTTEGSVVDVSFPLTTKSFMTSPYSRPTNRVTKTKDSFTEKGYLYTTKGDKWSSKNSKFQTKIPSTLRITSSGEETFPPSIAFQTITISKPPVDKSTALTIRSITASTPTPRRTKAVIVEGNTPSGILTVGTTIQERTVQPPQSTAFSSKDKIDILSTLGIDYINKLTTVISNEIPTHSGDEMSTSPTKTTSWYHSSVNNHDSSKISNKILTATLNTVSDRKGELKSGSVWIDNLATTPSRPRPPVIDLYDSDTLDMIIAFHMSRRASAGDSKRLKSFIKDLVSRADFNGGRTRLGLISYGESADVVFGLDEHRTLAEINQAIDAMDTKQGNDVVDSFNAMIEASLAYEDAFGRAMVPKALFMITDSRSTVNQGLIPTQRGVLEEDGIDVFSIGIGVGDKSELESMATRPRYVHTVNGFSDLDSLTRVIRRDVGSLRVNDRQPVIPEATSTPVIPIGPIGPIGPNFRTTTDPPIKITFPQSGDLMQRDIGNLVDGKLECYAEVDLVIILDSSTSVGVDNFEKMKNFVNELLKNADIDNDHARVGILTYSTGVKVEFQLNQYKTNADVETAVNNIAYTYGSTNTADAIATMTNDMFTALNGDRPGVPNVGIIITDGVSNINSRRTLPEAANARNAKIHVYAIGIGLADTRELDGMASPPLEENRFTVQSFDELKGFDRKIFQALCKVVPTKPPPVTVPITLPQPKGSTCTAEVDLVIILDSSTSVGTDNYNKMLGFCKDFLANADIDSGSVRVGIVSYSTGVEVEFTMDRYRTKQEVFDAIDKIAYRYGSTNTAGGLETTRTQLYTQANGDRPGVPDVVIILTDGVSNINSRRTIPEAEKLRAQGVHIYALGIGLQDTRELDAIATPPAAENSFNVQDFDELSALSDRVFQAFCPVATTPIPVKEPHGYDIAILVDSSSTPEQFAIFQKFARRFVRQAKIEDGEYRVGLLRYSTNADIQFDLNTYSATRDARFKVDAMKYVGGDSNAANAIDVANRQMFQTRAGDRAYARNYIILLTGNEQSLSTNDAWAAAERAEDEGIQLYVVGLEIGDTTELDETPSHPLSTYQYLTRTEREVMDVPEKIRKTLPPMPKIPPPMRPRPRLTTPLPITLPTNTGCGLAKVDIVIILDSSTSVGADNYEKMKSFCKEFLKNADLDSGNVRVGILTYSTDVKEEFYLNSYSTSSDVMAAIDNIKYRYGSTNTADSLKIMRTKMFTQAYGDRQGVPDIGIILTDGVSNINSRRTIPEAENARAANIHIYAIGIGLTDTRELDGIATQPASENSFNVQSFDELAVLSEKVFEAFCPVATTPTPRDTGYDLVVIMDSSVSQEYFDWMKSFTSNLAGVLNVDDDEFRIGLLRYSTDSDAQFNLDDYGTSAEIQDAVDDVTYKGGLTNTGAAIDYARTNMFVPREGDRDFARNFILLITGQDRSLSTNDAWRAAERAETDGIQLYVIGLNIGDRVEVDETSSHPLGTYQYLIRSEGELEAVPAQIYEGLLGMPKRPPPMRPRPHEPTVRVLRPRYRSAYGSPVTLECEIDSYPPNTEVQWIRVSPNNSPVVIDRRYSGATVRNPSLTINSPDFNDEGQYICTATNAAGTGRSGTTELQVEGSPPVAQIRQDTYEGDLNREITLECDVSGNPAVTSVYWMKEDGGTLVRVDTSSRRFSAVSPSSPSLTITDLETSDSGVYQCFAENIVGTGSSEKTNLNVNLPITLPPTSSPCGLAKVDIVIILDSSTSVGADNYEKMKSFCKEFLKNADLDSGNVRVGILTYSTDVKEEFYLNSYSTSTDVMAAIDNIKYRYGSTNTADSLKIMRTKMFTQAYGDRQGVPDIGIILTDGVSNINSRRTIPEAENARAANIHIYAIGIGLTDTRELDGIASQPASENSFNVQSFDELAVLSEKVFEAFCPVATTPTPRDTGYDLVVIMDSSVSQEYFDWMKSFTSNLAGVLSVDDDEFRIGLLRYSTDSDAQFSLDDYGTSAEIQDAVDEVTYKGGLTNTGAAIDYARTNMFVLREGDRDFARNFILLITGQDRSLSTNDAWRAAERAETDGIQLYVIGLNIDDRVEVDETSSHPLGTYQYLIRNEGELEAVPAQIYEGLLGMPKRPPPMRPRPHEPTVRVLRPRYRSAYGSPVTLECEVDSYPPHTEVQWIRVSPNNSPVVIDRRYSGASVRNPSLTINSPDFNDEGQYICTATNAAGTGRSGTTELQVEGSPPVAQIRQDTYEGDLNREITLECDVSGNPAVTSVYWMKEDGGTLVRVDTSSRRFSAVSPSSPSLTITDLETSDSGVYQCFAENIVGTGSSEKTNLNVNLPITLPPTSSPCGLAKVDIVIILDSSTSVGADNYEKMKSFCKEFLKNADLDSGNVRVGILTYSTDVKEEFYLNSYSTSTDVMAAIDNIKYRYGSTNTADSLKIMRTKMFTQAYGDRQGVPDIGIILTDGVSNINSRRTIPEAEIARAANIHIYAIGIGLTDTRELDGIASQPASENSFNVQSFDELAVLSEKVFEAFCPVATTPTPRDTGYDLVVIMDSSVSQEYFDWMKSFTRNLAGVLSVDDDEFRIGLLRYSTDSDTQFNLDDYGTSSEIQDAVDDVTYKGGLTNTGAAIDYARTNMFVPREGDRDFARNFILLITGQDRSLSTNDAWRAAERAETDGIQLYVIGLNIGDRVEVDETSSHPLGTYQYLIRNEGELEAVPAQIYEGLLGMPKNPPPMRPRPDKPNVRVLEPEYSARYGDSVTLDCIINSGPPVTDVTWYRVTNGERTPVTLSRRYSGSTQEYPPLTIETTELNDEGAYICSAENAAGRGFSDQTSIKVVGDPPNVQFLDNEYVGDESKDITLACTIYANPRTTRIYWRREVNGRMEDIDTSSPKYSQDAVSSLTIKNLETSDAGDYQCLADNPFGTGSDRKPLRVNKFTVTLPPTSSPCGLAQVDIVIILDSSTSVGDDNYQKMKDFCKDFLKNADLDSGNVQIGIVSYSTGVHIEFHMNSYSTSQDIMTAIDNIPYRYGSTNTADGLKTMRTQMYTVANGDRIGVPDIVIILTDGVSNINSRRTIPEAVLARDQGIHIYAVGIGLTDTRELDAMATPPAEENSFNVQTFDELAGLTERVFQAFCPVATTVAPRDTGYDLVVILDSSVSQEYFDWMKSFTRNLAGVLSVDDDEFRIGLLRYSTDSDNQFNLDDYGTSSDIQDAVDDVTYKSGLTNTGAAIDYARTNMFVPREGDRDFARNFILLITGQDRSLSTNDAWRAAERAETDGIQLYVIGLNIGDRVEVDETSSHPLSTYQYLIRNEGELEAVPAQIYEGLLGMPRYPPPMRPRPNKPSVRVLYPEYRAQYGRSVTLECVVDSKPPHSDVTWYRVTNGERTPVTVNRNYEGSTVDSPSLTIKSADLNDGGAYVCSAENPAGRGFSEETTVRVSGEGPIVRIPEDEYVEYLGEDVTIDCDVTSNPRATRVYWKRAETGEIIDTPSSKYQALGTSLTIRSLETSDSGDYVCAAENIFGSAEDRKPLRVLLPITVPSTSSPCGLAQVDIVIILDSSTSVGDDNYQKMKDFCKDFLKNADLDSGNVQIGIVSYSTGVHIEFHMNSYSTSQDIMTAIDNIPYRYGSTNTADGLKTMRTQMYTVANGDRIGVPDIVIILTDGVSNINSRRTIPEAVLARDQGIHIYAVGIGLTDTRELDAMATPPAEENSFNVQTFDELAGLTDRVFQAFCPVATTAAPLKNAYDVVMVMDSSVQEDEFNGWMKTYAKNFINTLSIEDEQYRLGLLRFSSDANVQFNLNKYNTKADILNAVDDVRYQAGGSTDVAGAFDKVRRKMFKQPKGDRDFARNYIVLLTGKERSDDTNEAWAAAERAEDEGIGIYVVGYGINDRMELDQTSSHPLSTFQYLVGDERELNNVPLRLQDSVVEQPEIPPPMRRRPRITDPEPCQDKTDLVIILDASTSVGEDNFLKMKQFCKDFLANADIDSGSVRAGLLTYSTDVRIEFQLGQFTTTKDVHDAIDNIAYAYGSTNTADAIKTMRTKMFGTSADRKDAPDIAIIVTDGVSNINGRRTIPEAENARSQKIHIYTIGIGLTDTKEVFAMATPPPEENSFNVQSFDELRGLDQKIFSSICPGRSTPVVVTTPEPTEGVTTPLPVVTKAPCGLSKTDLVIILDSSTSVGEENYKLMLNFVKDFLSNADIDSGDLRVGVVSYSTAVTVHFQLKDYTTKADVFNAIDNINYIFGSTNTADALKEMRSVMYTFRNGDRPDVKNIAMIITDGVSNINSRRTIPEAEKARDEGIHVYAIGIGLTDVRELEGMASRPVSENTFTVQSFDELKGLDQIIFASSCLTTTAPAPITTTPKPHGYDLVVVMDSSVPRQYFTWFKNFAKRLPNALDIDGGEYRIGLMRYSTTGDVQFNLDDYANDAVGYKRAVDGVGYKTGATNTDEAIDKVRRQMFRRRNGDRDYARNFILLLTANDQSSDTNRVWEAAEKAEDDGIYLYTIGLNIGDRTEIDETSSHPLSRYEYLVRRESDLYEVPGQLRYALNEEPEVPPPFRRRPRLTTTTVRQTTTTTTPKPTTTPRTHGYDLIFVLDSSVTNEHFNWMKDFTKDFVGKVDVDNGEYRIGLMRYSTYADAQFQLREYKNTASLRRAIDRVQRRPGSTNTERALDSVRTRMFTRGNGDRDYARNFVILLTGQDQSLNTNDAWRAAERLEDAGAGLYVIGLEIGDRTELDELASHPLSTYQFLTRRKSDLSVIPEQIAGGLKGMSREPEWPPHRPRPRITTTLPPTTTYRPRPPGKCTSQADIVFVLDSSGSLGQTNFYHYLNFTARIVDDIDVDSGNFRVGAVSFSDRARNNFFLNSYTDKEDIKRAIYRIPYVYGSTNTQDALRLTRESQLTDIHGDRPNVPNVIVIVTDGESNINHLQTLPQADMLKATGATCITVAVGFKGESTELQGLTSLPLDENLIKVENHEALTTLKEKIVEPLCTDENLCARSPCQNGAACFDGLRSYRCKCKPGFYGANCEKSCTGEADVVFMLDSSSGIGETTFERMKKYSESMVRQLSVEDCGVHVGFMKYSSAPMIQFNIGRYTDTHTINRAVDSIHYTRGRANMADAFREVRTRMFNTRSDRTGARNVIFLLSDGSADVKKEDTMMEAEMTISSGINIIPIGIQMRNREEMENIAAVQGVNVEEIRGDDTDVMAMSDQFLRPIREMVDFCSGSPCENGGTCYGNALGYRCECVPGFTGDTCNKRCQTRADVVFLVDMSRYVTKSARRQTKRFIKSLVKRMSFRNKMTAGIVQFGQNAAIKLKFSESYKKKNVLNAVSSLRRMRGNPNPAEAFRKARISVIDSGNDRPDAPNYVILISHSMRQESEVIEEANKLKHSGTKVIGVGVGMSDSDKEFMMAAVSSPATSHLYQTDSTSGLTDISDNIMAYLCNEKNMCQTNPCQNGGACVSENGGYYCECTEGYAGQNCEKVCEARADVAFLLDSSGSIGQENFRLVKDFVYNVVDEMTISKTNTRVGLASYSTQARLGFHLDEYLTKSAVKSGISSIGYVYGNTNTAAGIKMVRRSIFNPARGDRANAQNYLIIITDGVSNINAEATIPEAKKAKEEGAHIYTIGVGSFDPTELKAMASEPVDKNSFMIDDFKALSTLTTNLVKATCKDPSICDENPCLNGGRCSVGVGGSFVCTCPDGYSGNTCEKACVDRKDILFVLDSSASVSRNNFQYMLDFTEALVEEIGSTSNQHRFALITYSTGVNLIFSFGRYRSVQDVNSAVSSTPYTAGSTNTAGGLRMALEVFTSSTYGGRVHADDIVILLTDGKSNVNSEDTIPAADALKQKGVKIITVGIKIDDTEEIKAIASSDRDVFVSKDFKSLLDVKNDISENSCRGN